MGGQISLAVTLTVEQRLPLPDHAEVAVVDQRHLDRHTFDRAGGQFLIGHLEAAVAVDRPHLSVRAGHLGAHRRRDGVAHGAQSTRVEPGARLLVGDELRCPHLVLTDPGDVDGIRPSNPAQLGDDVLRAEAAVGLRIPTQRIGLAQSVEVGPPVGEVRIGDTFIADPVVSAAVLTQHRDQFGDDGFDVADDRHIGMAVLADLGRIDISVDHLGVGREGVQLAGHPVVETGAESDQQITLLQGGNCSHGAMHPGHPQVLDVAVRERPAGHQRGHHRNAGQLGQLSQFLAGLTADHSAADVEHWLAGRGDQLGGLLDLAAVRLGVRLVPGQVQLRRPTERARALQHVLGNVDENGAVSAGGGDVERLGDRPRDIVTVANQEVVLGDRHGHAGDVGLLEGVGADQRPPDLPGDGDHRDGVHLRIGQRGDQVRRTRTGGGHHDPDASGGMGITAGGMARTLLVADQDVAQLLGVEQRIVDRQYRTAGDPEDHLDAEFLQRPHHRLGAGELLGRDALGALATGLVVMGAVGLGSRRLGCSLRRCAHCCPRYPRCSFDKKKPPSAGQLYEGCALVRLARPGRGRARHQRADLLLRTLRRTTYR